MADLHEVPTQQLRVDLRRVLARVTRDGDHIAVTTYGEPVAVLLSIADYRRLTGTTPAADTHSE